MALELVQVGYYLLLVHNFGFLMTSELVFQNISGSQINQTIAAGSTAMQLCLLVVESGAGTDKAYVPVNLGDLK